MVIEEFRYRFIKDAIAIDHYGNDFYFRKGDTIEGEYLGENNQGSEIGVFSNDHKTYLFVKRKDLEPLGRI